MGLTERKNRQRLERKHRIVAAARLIAERDGWAAVTIRRLADEIEYSQPVLYAHFENRDAILAAVALEGFRELTAVIRDAANRSTSDRHALTNTAEAYLAFARDRPAVYAVMFTLPNSLRFAQAETPPDLRDAFRALSAVVRPAGIDLELATETLWATLHGLADLERSHRIRPSARAARVALVVDWICSG